MTLIRKPSAAEIIHGTYFVPILIALAQSILQIACHGQYGYFRDELYYIACSDHLAWGYVDQPPFSIALLAVNRLLLGDSLQALRFLPTIACAAVVILTAAITRRMGGDRFAQGFASLSVVAAHTLIGNARYYTMNPFDVFFWTLAGYFVVRILTEDRPKLWLAFGVVVGFGLLNKYSVGFLCIGLTAGLLLTRARKHLATGWFWLGAAVAFLIFLPHVVWEIQNHYPTLEFMRNASQIKNVPIPATEFFAGQLRDMNYLSAPVWLLGLWYFFFDRSGKRYRTFGWMYVVIFTIMVAGHSKVYYLSPIYPAIFAGGAMFIGQVARSASLNRVRLLYAGLIAFWAVIVLPFTLPVLPVETFIAIEKLTGQAPHAEERSGVGLLPSYYADMFGWEKLAADVAKAYRMLTPEEQSECVIFMRNYGEAGAVDFFGKKYGLPGATCAHNNYWLWGPGPRMGHTAIILGNSRTLEDNLADLRRKFQSVELAGVTNEPYAMPYENGRMIFICKGMNTTFQKIWADERFYI